MGTVLIVVLVLGVQYGPNDDLLFVVQSRQKTLQVLGVEPNNPHISVRPLSPIESDMF